MLLKSLFNHTNVPLINKSLTASTTRQRAIANNIANVNTPGYQRLEVRFEEEFQKSMRRRSVSLEKTDDMHMGVGTANNEPQIIRSDDPDDPSGVNNVDVEIEMANLAKNQLLYSAAAKFATRTFSKINTAIRGHSR